MLREFTKTPPLLALSYFFAGWYGHVDTWLKAFLFPALVILAIVIGRRIDHEQTSGRHR